LALGGFMGNMESIIKNATLETLAERIRKMPFFEGYIKATKEEGLNSANLLQMFVLIASVSDKDLLSEMTKVSYDMLFETLDLKFKNNF
jgi:hypothetical protein